MPAEPPRLLALMVANTAPPPSTADASANNCEMLTNEPTTSSGDGMAKACPLPSRQIANATHAGMTTTAAASAASRTQLRRRILEFPQVAVAEQTSRGVRRKLSGVDLCEMQISPVPSIVKLTI